mmetsp:Transcript_2035/g.2557  ORF Transcript_2035/g.2557 Transcript_2035/m.2557 type:complete len:309 (+) Transcript_2035:119-1045(+)|eukprot:CAMPEP_0172503092 /NCGR_PEP_ID=MMETSP1066-20121228/166032_1 /TAXON_ID=671091 /ORGANISM="Coscinodiscus wailesii, Strain CCMP2513" /LENGTH=308 /DNA_ID=CAMNT_0013278681 /DNA_START=119 /DNA_END=1045 /DNA_ORIENTATION=-
MQIEPDNDTEKVEELYTKSPEEDADQSEDPTGLGCPRSISIGPNFEIHYTYFVVAVISVIYSYATYRSTRYSLCYLLSFGPILFITVLLHELGIVLAAHHLGWSGSKIVITPLGGQKTTPRPSPITHYRVLLVSLVGPLTFAIQMFIWWATLKGFNFKLPIYITRAEYVAFGSWSNFWIMLGHFAFLINLTLMCFHLFLPVFPFDGAHILFSLLQMKGDTAEKAGLNVAMTSLLSSLVVFIIGIHHTFTEGMQVLGFGLILLALWVVKTSLRLSASSRNGNLKEHPIFYSEEGLEEEETDGYVNVESP